jgi:predicted ABC-type ATPase
LHDFIEQGKSCVIESTLSGRYLIKFISLVKEQNYQITLTFIFVDSPEISIERISGRVKKGGHFVPEDDVRRRFIRGRQNFWNVYKKLVDRWSLVYNSGNNFEYVVIAKNNEKKILDEYLFEKFLKELK